MWAYSQDIKISLILFVSGIVLVCVLPVVLVMRNDMIEQWRDQLPEGTPNYFLTNITQNSKDDLARHLVILVF